MSDLDVRAKGTVLYVAVDDPEKMPCSLVGTHPLRFGKPTVDMDDITGLVEIGGDPIAILWAIATRDVPLLWALTNETGDFAHMAMAGAEKILQEIIDVGLVKR